jgi:uncharacterized protein (TIGR02646 family)
MIHIQKRTEPQNLTQWRATYQNNKNFGYDLIDSNLRQVVRLALILEQRGLCAYTGRRIDATNCHIEHPKPQTHCLNGEDVFYSNMLACVPAPNAPGLPYGAHKKGSWPAPTQESLFVSPLRSDCTERFSFTLRGEIHPTNPADEAAKETIKRLGLDHAQLIQLRKAAIDAILVIQGRGPASVDLKVARRRINQLKAAEQSNGILEVFCFVLKQALEKHIVRLETIRVNKMSKVKKSR